MDKTIEEYVSELNELVSDEQLNGGPLALISPAEIVKCFTAVPKALRRDVYLKFTEVLNERRLHVR